MIWGEDLDKKLNNIKNDNNTSEKFLKRISLYLLIIIILLLVLIFRIEKLNKNFTNLTQNDLIEFSTNENYNDVLDVFIETTENIGDTLPMYNEISSTTEYSTNKNNEKTTIETTITSPSSASDKITYVINKNSKKMHYKTCSFVSRMNEENKSVVQLNKDELKTYLNSGYSFCSSCGG